jgi:hypothetical protein
LPLTLAIEHFSFLILRRFMPAARTTNYPSQERAISPAARTTLHQGGSILPAAQTTRTRH